MNGGEITPHFAWVEAACHCGCTMPDDIARNVQAFAFVMEVVREVIGAPIGVDDWYRCPAHNAAIGGAPDSMHLYGLAVDFNAVGWTPAQVQQKMLELQAQGKIGGVETGTAAHTHIDGGAIRTFEGVSK